MGIHVHYSRVLIRHSRPVLQKKGQTRQTRRRGSFLPVASCLGRTTKRSALCKLRCGCLLVAARQSHSRRTSQNNIEDFLGSIDADPFCLYAAIIGNALSTCLALELGKRRSAFFRAPSRHRSNCYSIIASIRRPAIGGQRLGVPYGRKGR